MFGQLLSSTAGGGEVPRSTTLGELLDRVREADDRRFKGRW
jgi:hypothetical protein